MTNTNSSEAATRQASVHKRRTQRRRHRLSKRTIAIGTVIAALTLLAGIPGTVVATHQLVDWLNPPGVIVEYGLPMVATITPMRNGLNAPSVPTPDLYIGTFLLTNRSDSPVTLLDVSIRDHAQTEWSQLYFMSSTPSTREVTAQSFSKTLDKQFTVNAHSSAWLSVTIQAEPGTCGAFGVDCFRLKLRANDGSTLSFNGYDTMNSCAPRPESPCGRMRAIWEAAFDAPAVHQRACEDRNTWLNGQAVEDCRRFG